MKTQFREMMKVNTALSTEDHEPLLTIRFDFDPEFEGNSYEFQHSMVEQVHSAMGDLLKELETKAIWQANIEMAESGEEPLFLVYLFSFPVCRFSDLVYMFSFPVDLLPFSASFLFSNCLFSFLVITFLFQAFPRFRFIFYPCYFIGFFSPFSLPLLFSKCIQFSNLKTKSVSNCLT